MPARTVTAHPQRQLRRHAASGIECFEGVWRAHRTRHHAHPYYQLTQTVAGVGRFDYLAGQARVPPGCFALFHPDEPHVLESVGRSEGWHVRVLHLPPRLLEQAGKPLFQPAPFVSDTVLQAAFDAVWDAVQAREDTQRVVTAARELGRVLAQRPGLEPKQDPDSRLVRRCLAHLDSVLDRNVPIAELASLVARSPAQVRRMLVARTGLPPHALHLQRRIEHSKSLLAAGVPVSEAAQATGFGDQAHFTRHFTILVGVSPARYASNR